MHNLTYRFGMPIRRRAASPYFMTTTGVTRNNLNLREQGSTDATIIKTLPAGTTITIQSGMGTPWLYVTAPDSSVGYVSSVYVTINSEPVVTPPGTITTITTVTTPNPTDPSLIKPISPAQPIVPPTIQTTIQQTTPTVAAPVSTKPITPSGDHGQMVNIRASGAITGTLLEQVSAGDVLTPLETDTAVAAKLGTVASENQWINVKTPSGKVGFIAAWLVAYWTVNSGTTPAVTPILSVDDYLASIPPNEAPIPQGYADFWAQSQTLGLPAPFDVLPAQLGYPDIAHTPVNGFGPNTFSFHNWSQWYTHVDGMHNGLDLIIPTGTPLLAVSDGVIVGTQLDWPFLGSNDPCIILWCYLPPSVVDTKGNRMLSNLLVAYAHLSDNTIVKRHDVVKAGDVIAKSGSPGGQPGNAHLHLETHLLSGDSHLPNNSGRRLLRDYSLPQPFDNHTPFNPLLFFSERLARYYMHQGHVIGYAGGATYPTADQLTQNGLNAWVTGGFLPDFFSLGYYQYDATLIIWKHTALPFPNGLYDLATTNKRIANFMPFKPYPADFLNPPK